MEIVHLKTSSKRKKPTKAEQDAMAAFKKMQERRGAVPKFARTPAPVKSKTARLRQDPGSLQGVQRPGKLDSGSTAPKPSVKYTGNVVIGIATLHKSNAVPIINQQEAEDISKMRR